MKKTIFFALLFLGSVSLNAQIYKWTDADGVVHFSDSPHPGAMEIELPGVQTYSPSSNEPPSDTGSKDPKLNENTVEYTVSINQPKNEATIRNNQGYVPVVVEISPDLKPGIFLQIIFDGEPMGKPQASLVFALNEVKRGTHHIAISVVDSDGNVLATSDPVTIFMHRPTVQTIPAPVSNN